MIDEKVFEGKPSGFLVYNSQSCKDIVDSIEEMVRPGYVIIAYQYSEAGMLVHPGKYYGRKGACSALKQILNEIETQGIHCQSNDKKIREMTGDPSFSTKAVLAAFLKEELRKIK